MNARQKAKKLKQENKWLWEHCMDIKRDKVKTTRIPTMQYKAKVTIPKQLAEEDGMPYVRKKLAQQMAEMLEENIWVELYTETEYCITYCSDIYIAFDV